MRARSRNRTLCEGKIEEGSKATEGSASPPLLDIERLRVVREGNVILDDVTMGVAPGTLHAVIGANGAGKSTLIRALLGQIPFSGEIRLHWRGSGRIGYVPQTIAIDPSVPMTVADFLTVALQRLPVWLASRRATRQAFHPVVEMLALGGLLRRRLGVLSGGELRRVLLAQALLPEPELLLLDEPEGGIDWLARETLIETFLRLRRGGKTILLVTHDLEEVRRVADRVTCLFRSIRFDGPPAEVLTPEAAFSAFQPERPDD